MYPMPPEKMSHAVQPESMQAGIAEKYLKRTSGSRISLFNRLYIFPDTFEHAGLPINIMAFCI